MGAIQGVVAQVEAAGAISVIGTSTSSIAESSVASVAAVSKEAAASTEQQSSSVQGITVFADEPSAIVAELEGALQSARPQ